MPFDVNPADSAGSVKYDVPIGFCASGGADVEVAADTQSSLPSSDGGLYIGADKDRQLGSSWQGLIDDVKIYDRAIVP